MSELTVRVRCTLITVKDDIFKTSSGSGPSKWKCRIAINHFHCIHFEIKTCRQWIQWEFNAIPYNSLYIRYTQCTISLLPHSTLALTLHVEVRASRSMCIRHTSP